MCLDHGIMGDACLADNGVFKAIIFVQPIYENKQYIRYYGVNRHNQNGVAEWSICTVSEMARVMIIHSSLR